MRTAAELGIRVPDDVSVVGFDNIPESALAEPPLTTVDQSIQAPGDDAVRTLARPDRASAIATTPSQPIHITLPDPLVIRRTQRSATVLSNPHAPPGAPVLKSI